jgi:hypothetical protein
MRCERLQEGSDAFRVARHPSRKHLGAHEAEVCERFVASEKIDHLYLVRPAWMHCFQSRKERLYRKMDCDAFELFPDRRMPAQLVGGL